MKNIIRSLGQVGPKLWIGHFPHYFIRLAHLGPPQGQAEVLSLFQQEAVEKLALCPSLAQT